MPTRSALARLLATPENRSALTAIQDLLLGLTATGDTPPNPLYLHGPSGTGKTVFIRAVAVELQQAGFDVCLLSANDFAEKDDFKHARAADLLVVEDMQHLPTRYVAPLIALMDDRLALGASMIFTALDGPARLNHRGTRFPNRLTDRLAAGLVVALEPAQAATRRKLLKLLGDEASVKVAPDVLDWLAQHLIGGGRQLEGTIKQLKALQRLQAKPLRLTDIQTHFRAQVDAKTPSVKRITEEVSGYFQVEPKHVRSARRSRDVLLPRQVSMYLARQLTNLSLEQIGKNFGGRDHKTVQHACKKVAEAMKSDAVLSGAVRQIHAELA